MVKERDGGGCAFGWPVDEEGDDLAVLESADDLEEGEGVLADDESFDAVLGTGVFADFREGFMGFRESEGEESDTLAGEDVAAELPVAEVWGDEEDAFFALEFFVETFSPAELAEEVFDIGIGFVEPEVDKFSSELLVELFGFEICGVGLLGEEGEEVLCDDVASGRCEVPVERHGEGGEGMEGGAGDPADCGEGELPEVGAVEFGAGGGFDGWGGIGLVVRGILGVGDSPPGGEEEDRGEDDKDHTCGAEAAEAGEAGVTGEREGGEAGDCGGAAEEEGAADAVVDGGEVSVMASEGELHMDAVIDAGAEEDGEGDDIHEVPGPACEAHDGLEDEEAKQEGGEAEEDFRESIESERERAEEEQEDGGEDDLEVVLDVEEEFFAEGVPIGEPGFSGLGKFVGELDGVGIFGVGMDDAEGEGGGGGAVGEAGEGPLAEGALGEEEVCIGGGGGEAFEDPVGERERTFGESGFLADLEEVSV